EGRRRRRGERGGRERPEALPLLDDRVQPLAVGRDPGVGEQAAVAQRPRPELGPPRHPPDRGAAGDRRRRPLVRVGALLGRHDRGPPLDDRRRRAGRRAPGGAPQWACRIGPLGRAGGGAPASAAPMAARASWEAGCTKTRPNRPPAASTPLALQLWATPPVRQRSLSPVAADQWPSTCPSTSW